MFHFAKLKPFRFHRDYMYNEHVPIPFTPNIIGLCLSYIQPANLPLYLACCSHTIKLHTCIMYILFIHPLCIYVSTVQLHWTMPRVDLQISMFTLAESQGLTAVVLNILYRCWRRFRPVMENLSGARDGS